MRRLIANLKYALFFGPIVAMAVLAVWMYGWWNAAAWARGVRAVAIWWAVFSAALLAPAYAIIVPHQVSVAMSRLRTWRRTRRLRHGLCPLCGHVLRSTDERCGGCGWTGINPRSVP